MVNSIQANFPYDIKTKQEIAGKLKKGDLIFTKYHGSFTRSLAQKPSAIISLIQSLVNRLRGTKDQNEFYRMTHAVVVVDVDYKKGKVLIAESLPVKNQNQLRIAELFTDPYLKLKPNDPWEYQVLRMNPDKAGIIPIQAAKIAESLASKDAALGEDPLKDFFKGTHVYSFFKGLISLFSNRRQRVRTGEFAKRLFKQVADEQLRQTEGRGRATGGKRDRAFFCSYFAAHVFQQAEIWQKMHQIRRMDGVETGLAKIKAIPEGPKRTKALRKWAQEMAKQHREEISSLVKNFNLDPKHISPKDLMSYLKKTELFKEVMSLTPRISR